MGISLSTCETIRKYTSNKDSRTQVSEGVKVFLIRDGNSNGLGALGIMPQGLSALPHHQFVFKPVQFCLLSVVILFPPPLKQIAR